MRTWTVQDEINLCKWVDDRGFKIVYIPAVEEWGFYHVDKPGEINGGFEKLVELKQYFVNLKGDNKNVQIISEGDFHGALERARNLPKYH